MTKLDNQVYEVPEDTRLVVMDLVNTAVDCGGKLGRGCIFRPRPGVKKFLRYHRKGRRVPVVICSDVSDAEIKKILKRTNLNKHVDGVYGREHMIDDVTKDIGRICEERGVAPGKTLMVEDIPMIDGESARRAGVRYLQVPMPRGREDKFTYRTYLRRKN